MLSQFLAWAVSSADGLRVFAGGFDFRAFVFKQHGACVVRIEIAAVVTHIAGIQTGSGFVIQIEYGFGIGRRFGSRFCICARDGRRFRFGMFGEGNSSLLRGFRLPETILHPFGGADSTQVFLNFAGGDGFRFGADGILCAAAAVFDAVFLFRFACRFRYWGGSCRLCGFRLPCFRCGLIFGLCLLFKVIISYLCKQYGNFVGFLVVYIHRITSDGSIACLIHQVRFIFQLPICNFKRQ